MCSGRGLDRPPRFCARAGGCGRLSSAWPSLTRLDLLLARDCTLGPAPAASVGPRALAAHRQAAAVPLAAIRADLGQPLDVHRDLAAQVTLDEDVFCARHPVDDLAQACDLFLAEVLGALARIDAGVLDDLLGGRVSDAVDVGHGDDDALGRRNVDARDSCHLVPTPVSAYAWASSSRSRAPRRCA